MPHHQGAQTRFNTGVGCDGLFEPGQFSRSHGCPCYLMLAFSSPGVWYLEQWRFLVSMWREHSLSAGGGALLAGGEIGQHSWGDWPSSGEWGWLGEAGSVSALLNLCI